LTQEASRLDTDFLGTDLDALRATEAFRLGIQAYNRYAFNEAILSFEQALNYKPGTGVLLDYLGRAYYRSGLEEIALRRWREAADAYGAGSFRTVLVNAKAETVLNRRSLYAEMDEGARFVQAGRFPGKDGDNVFFRQPTSVLPLEDGSVWVAAYGSNELVPVDPNGLLKRRARGHVTSGLDRPYDLARGSDGRLYVSEFRGGRVSVLSGEGQWLSFIGSKGRGDGQLIGPQGLTLDEAGYLYVVDYGNRRVCKFDPDGTFIQSFGKREGAFSGFISPTGIAVRDGTVFVADNVRREIVTFDENGEWTGVLLGTLLRGPESLRFLDDGRLLVADVNRILLLSPESSLVTEAGAAGNTNVRITDARPDANGNILAAHFDAGEVGVMTDINDVAAGLFVQIERVDAANFPLVQVELSVHDRHRRPIVGLDERNFALTESNLPVDRQLFLGAGDSETTPAIAVLIERSPQTLAERDSLAIALRDINAAFAGYVPTIISAGVMPTLERFDGSAAGLELAARGDAGVFSPRWAFDEGLRLAASSLLPLSKKRAVIFVGSGSFGQAAFEKYSLSEMAAYMANNGVSFYAVSLGEQPSPELEFLCGETGGQVLRLFQPQGIAGPLQKILTKPSGAYYLSFHSRLPTNFGQDFLPIEAEVYILERSGRDRIGYYAPLE
jgi:DNA-binding beta-propeller fold protein YncE